MKSRARATAQWFAIVACSATVGAVLSVLRIPAALLLGPMVTGIVFGVAGAGARVPERAFLIAQGVIGCMIARMAPLSIASELLTRWPVFAFGVLAVIATGLLLGWLLARMQVLPGTAVLWGSTPGAATAMIVMAEAYGADSRLVAFMQYLRVAAVAAVASVVARAWGLKPQTAADIAWFAPVAWPSFLETLTLAVLGPLIALRLRLRSGAFLLPLAAGLVLSHAGLLKIELPPGLLALSYAIIGWAIGLRFTRSLLLHAARALPRVLACIMGLIALCAVLGGVLVVTAGVDPLTAYLATSPGGADAVAIIAASSNVDLPFVMAMQTARLGAIILLAPAINRYIAASRIQGHLPHG